MFLDDITHLDDSMPVLLFAHGAGAGGESDCIKMFQCALTEQKVQLVRFNFNYMQTMLREQTRRPPPKLSVLIDEFAHALDELQTKLQQRIWIGGKSMGGRVASHLAARLADAPNICNAVHGVVVLGFPFHAPRKPPKNRLDHLPLLATPMCILQGTRDALGSPAQVATYTLNPATVVNWIDTADHDFKPLKRSGTTQQQCLEQAASIARTFMTSLHSNL